MMHKTKTVRDLLPAEVSFRQEVLKKIIAVFKKNSYQEIVTPTFEEYDYISAALPNALKQNAYRFFDHQGTQMILRPDITTQVARVVATKMQNHKGPLRLFYSGDVYRTQQREIGQHNQFHQIGVELYNVSSAKGDEEIIKLVEECTAAIGLKRYTIAQTNVNKINRLAPSKKRALLDQDFVSFGRLPKKDELMAVDIDYYTGLYFECYVPEIGYILGGGGRYDNLCGIFGKDRPAVGFAFNLDKLVLALGSQREAN